MNTKDEDQIRAAIEHAKGVAAKNGCNKCAVEHLNLALWLSELIVLRMQLASIPKNAVADARRYQYCRDVLYVNDSCCNDKEIDEKLGVL